MGNKYKKRRVYWGVGTTIAFVGLILANPAAWQKVYLSDLIPKNDTESSVQNENNSDSPLATAVLEKIEVKGRAPKTGYSRDKFYDTWPNENGCNLRQRILKRDFGETAKIADDKCTVIAGKYYEPYNGEEVEFIDKKQIAKNVQIDHIVALSDAWQKGAQYKTEEIRFNIATDPLNLIAADASANMQKSDSDAASWLPKNKSFRCQYVSRQIAVKYKYGLWVTSAEKDAMQRVLRTCPDERTTGITL